MDQKTNECQKLQEIDGDFLNYTESKQIHDNESATVCVTGASGFIASHCIKLLLTKGYNVNGTVTGDITSAKYQWLFEICEEASNKLKLFQANLLSPHSFDSAIKNCDYVFHIASPVRMNITDYQKNMLEPAVNGTLDILNSCLSASKLKRVVFTSSLYAMGGGAPKKGKIYDETDWNDEDTLNSNPYGYSKTIAEQSAWQWMKENKFKISFDFISILPALVIGEELNIKSKLSAGNAFVYRFLRGRYGRINAAYPICDIRDIAAAHLFFIEGSKAVECDGRYAVDGHRIFLSELREYLELYCDRHCIDSPGYESCCKSCCKCDYLCCGYCCISCIGCCCVPKFDVIPMMLINKGKRIVNDEKIKSLGFKLREIEHTLDYTLDYFLQQRIVLQEK